MRAQQLPIKKSKTMKKSKITSEKSPDASDVSMKRTLTSLESDASPDSLKLAQSNTSSSEWKAYKEMKPTASFSDFRLEKGWMETKERQKKLAVVDNQLSSDEVSLLRALLASREVKDYTMKKAIGIVKKEGENKGRLFSCLKTPDGKIVPKTFKLLDSALCEIADLRSGVKKMTNGAKKYWHAWFTKENDDMVMGSYEESVESDEPSLEEGESV